VFHQKWLENECHGKLLHAETSIWWYTYTGTNTKRRKPPLQDHYMHTP
jgi:hypothetical protein